MSTIPSNFSTLAAHVNSPTDFNGAQDFLALIPPEARNLPINVVNKFSSFTGLFSGHRM